MGPMRRAPQPCASHLDPQHTHEGLVGVVCLRIIFLVIRMQPLGFELSLNEVGELGCQRDATAAESCTKCGAQVVAGKL